VSSHIRLRIDLAYDGAPFAGYARQPDQATVQGCLEDACERVLGQPVSLVCAGRTDRGVHALAQVCHLDVDVEVGRAGRAVQDVEVLRQRLDALAGPAITVWAVRRVGHDFDARFSATERHYRYRLVDREVAPPLARHDHWVVGEALSVPVMRAAGKLLVGEHDFASFCRKREGATTMRRVVEATVRRPGDGRIDVRFVGTAFCHQQVRSMVGCLVEVGRGQRPPDWVGEVLAARDRRAAARVAPPEGLVLERVSYGRRWPSAPPRDAVGGSRGSRR
jgi:tRNA pseudouridine38-40 synthase